jgi:hypothetical protein
MSGNDAAERAAMAHSDACPTEHHLLRDCSSCGRSINRLSESYVVVAPSWKRCNDLLCYDCFSLTMRSAQVVIKALNEGAQVWIMDRLGVSTEVKPK